jgi:hypothetical protein
MALKQWLSGAAGALALAAMTGAAHSASLGSMVTDFKPNVPSNVERAQYRVCSMEQGVRRCRSVGPNTRRAPRVLGYRPPSAVVYGYAPAVPLVYGYQATAPVYGYQPVGPVLYGYQGIPSQYGYEFPDQYPVGTRAWWESMNQTTRDGSNSNR